MELIDIGVNLTNSRLYHDRDSLRTAALNQGVVQQIITGTSYQSSVKACTICEEVPDYYFSTAGCHPHDAKDFTNDDLLGIKQLLQHNNVIAIGECGLDFNRNFSPPDIQTRVFATQIELAVDTKLPLFLHQRDAHQAFLTQLTPHASQLSGVCHCFTGNKSEMKSYLDLGFYIGITGWLCDERRGSELQEALKYLPLDRMLLETDAPYLLPRNITPKPKNNLNTSDKIIWVLTKAAEILQMEIEELASITTKNCRSLFALDSDSNIA